MNPTGWHKAISHRHSPDVRRLHRIARRFAHYVIRQFAAAAETHPELSIAEMLPLCEAHSHAI
jgi:hypothetical protein